MVRRMLKDNKVLGTSAGIRAAVAPGLVPAGSAARYFGQSQTGLCERPGTCLDKQA